MTHRLHLDLLDHAGAVRAAECADDAESMHAALRVRYSELVEHGRGERANVEALAPPLRDLVRRDQDDLVELVAMLLSGVSGDDGTRGCVAAARTLNRRLMRQARLERADGAVGER